MDHDFLIAASQVTFKHSHDHYVSLYVSFQLEQNIAPEPDKAPEYDDDDLAAITALLADGDDFDDYDDSAPVLPPDKERLQETRAVFPPAASQVVAQEQQEVQQCRHQSNQQHQRL